jgi:CRP-like cAMP-binding protein
MGFPRRESWFARHPGVRAALDERASSLPAVALPAGSRRGAGDLPASRLLVVEEGVVLMRSPVAERRRNMIVACCTSGAVLAPPRDGETIQALTDAWLTVISADAMHDLLAAPAVAELLLGGLEETLTHQREAVRALAAIRHVDRVRDELIELARDHGRVCRDGIRIDLPLTHDLIADMVGCARETVTRALDELAASGFVARRGRYYHLLVDAAALSA